jgi:surfactin synthase thioesterase subunit
VAVKLICLPFAGAGASLFWPWREFCPPGIELWPVQLPGRERRIREVPFRDLRTAAGALSTEICQSGVDGPVAIFGHSLGALLGYEMANRLRMSGRSVTHLFASGAPGPAISRLMRTSRLADDSFLEQVERLAGYRHRAFDTPELRRALLPTLRADVEMQETYRPGVPAVLDVPVVAMRGADDHLVNAADLGRWSDAAGAGFRQLELPGGHMYLLDDVRTVVQTVAEICLGAPVLEQ